MNLQTIKHNFKLGVMKIEEIGWLIKELEQTQQEFASMDESAAEFDTDIRQLQEENKALTREICRLKAKTGFKVHEENLKLAQINFKLNQELALLKGEMSG